MYDYGKKRKYNGKCTHKSLKTTGPTSVLVRYAHKMLNFIRRFLASAIKKLRFIALGLTKTFYIRPIYPFVLNTFCRYVYNS